MFCYETVGFTFFICAVIHNAEIIMNKGIKKFVVAVAVIQSAFFLPPEIGVEFRSYGLGFYSPFISFTVSEYVGDFGKRHFSVVGIGHDIHRFIGKFCLTVWRLITSPCVGTVKEPNASVLSGVPFAEGFKTAVSVGISCSP